MKFRDLIPLINGSDICVCDITGLELGVITKNEIRLNNKHLEREVLSISPYSDTLIDITVK